MHQIFELLWDVYKEEYELNLKESLTKTFQIDQSIGNMHRNLNRNGLKKGDDYLLKKSGNIFHLVILNSTRFYVENDIIKDADMIGWIPSFIKIKNGYEGKWDVNQIPSEIKPETSIDILFEAKFDEQIGFRVPEYLYHAIPEQNYKDISKIGLVSKTRSKSKSHPERVFLSRTENDVEKLSIPFYENTGQKNWTILKVDTDSVPGGYFSIYKDTKYDGAFYTMNTIPNYAIEKIKDITI
jgi:hypothetical protein